MAHDAPKLADLTNLPDFAVLTRVQTAAATGLSVPTLERMHRRKEGPRCVKLSDRRVGYPAADLREWLRQRSA